MLKPYQHSRVCKFQEFQKKKKQELLLMTDNNWKGESEKQKQDFTWRSWKKRKR